MKAEVEKWDWIKWIEFLRPHLHLQMCSPFSDALSDIFVEIRLFIRLTVCLVLERFPEAVVDETDYRRLLKLTASGYLMVINWLITVHFGISCSTTVNISLRRWLLVAFVLCFWCGIVFLDEFEKMNGVFRPVSFVYCGFVSNFI